VADTQKQFEQFHDAIKLGRFTENQTLREKRDIIRNKLKERLPGVFELHNETSLSFSFWDQGSYELDTGTQPPEGDYDIDQGLSFVASTHEWSDPVVLKQRVYEALVGHTKDVQIREPCVTVFYQREDEPIYHVDIAVYSDRESNADGKTRLARGKSSSAPEYRRWEPADPQGLLDTILARFEADDRKQFRRIVRYLKRWGNVNFSSEGHARPVGIGLTVLVYDHLQPKYSDVFSRTPDDLASLCPLVQAVLNRFQQVWDEDGQRWMVRVSAPVPAELWDDPFRRMTNKQMETFHGKLQDLRDALDAAAAEVDPVEACKRMRKVFGGDFPIPEKEETAKRQAPAIVSSSNSA
jgi:hypothetical protein